MLSGLSAAKWVIDGLGSIGLQLAAASWVQTLVSLQHVPTGLVHSVGIMAYHPFCLGGANWWIRVHDAVCREQTRKAGRSDLVLKILLKQISGLPSYDSIDVVVERSNTRQNVSF